MDDKEILLTKEGLAKLQEEYRDLVEIQKPKVLKDLANARSMGDLSENAAYAEARQRQSFIEGRITELSEILKNAKVVENKKSGKAQLGSKIRVHLDGQEEEFWLVSADEANIHSGKISKDSPLGQVLLGKKAGEKVRIEVPVGEVEYTILGVE